MLTNKEYVHKSGLCCPSCKKGTVIGMSFEPTDTMETERECRCDECGFHWEEIHTLIGWKNGRHGRLGDRIHEPGDETDPA